MKLRITQLLAVLILIGFLSFKFMKRTVYFTGFLKAYKLQYYPKIDSTIEENQKRNSTIGDINNLVDRMVAKHNQLNNKLNIQLRSFDSVFTSYHSKTGFDFNQADTLTILIAGNNTERLEHFMIWSGKDTVKSNVPIALVREVNNGSGLEPIQPDATLFTLRKAHFDNEDVPVFQLVMQADTAYAYESELDCPFDFSPVILTAKKTTDGYKIVDYYLHQFQFVSMQIK